MTCLKNSVLSTYSCFLAPLTRIQKKQEYFIWPLVIKRIVPDFLKFLRILKSLRKHLKNLRIQQLIIWLVKPIFLKPNLMEKLYERIIIIDMSPCRFSRTFDSATSPCWLQIRCISALVFVGYYMLWSLIELMTKGTVWAALKR